MIPEIDQPLAFASAYRQLRPAARQLVDTYILGLEREAERLGRVVATPPVNPTERQATMYAEPLVQAAIAERVRDIREAMELSARKILRSVSNVGFSNIQNYMVIGADGQPAFDMSRCTPAMMEAVKTIKVTETLTGRKFEFVLHDKMAALSLLMRYAGMLEPDNDEWASQRAKRIEATATPGVGANDTTAHAADMYASLING